MSRFSESLKTKTAGRPVPPAAGPPTLTWCVSVGGGSSTAARASPGPLPPPPCPRLAQRPAQGAAWQGGALRKLLGIPPQRWTVPSLPPSAGTCGWSFYSWGYNPIPLNLVTKIVPVSATGSPHSRPESFSKFSSVARRRPLCPAGWPSPEWVSHYLSPHGVPAPPGSGFLLTVSGAAPVLTRLPVTSHVPRPGPSVVGALSLRAEARGAVPGCRGWGAQCPRPLLERDCV